MAAPKKKFDFRTLVTVESRPLRNYALKLTQDLDDAEDLVQDDAEVRRMPFAALAGAFGVG